VPAARVALFGFPNTKHEERPRRRPEAPGLHLEMDSAFYEGEIVERLPDGYMVRGAPPYVTMCEAPGGMSGVPLIDLRTGAVHGVLSSSMTGSHSVCTDLGALLLDRITRAFKNSKQ
jgi:hypothetical protein